MDYVTEAEALSDIYEDVEYDLDDLRGEIDNRNGRLRKAYNLAKNKKVGEIINCAYCNKKHIKKQYSQAFCPPIKKGRAKKHRCKDKYWNSVDESRWRQSLPRLSKESLPPPTFYFDDIA